ncbi:uncharacterized protein LOC136092745 [Hydra vulgaris]|uniref:uncharacterized protein LOC136092745 n=1 Tax=Hydra vulgaris TaxID=6087 RepID=UPI0032E9D24A
MNDAICSAPNGSANARAFKFSRRVAVMRTIPVTGATSLVLATETFSVLQELNSLKSIQPVLLDNTATKTGPISGLVVNLEEFFKRKLHLIGCALHQNELPLRALFVKVDGDTTGPRSFSGLLGKRSTKHRYWGVCHSDSRYPDKLPAETFFLRFPKPGKIKEWMPNSEKEKQNIQTELCKKWIHACGRKSFNINNIKKDTYICSLHFFESKGPTQKAETSDLVDFQIESVSQSYCGLNTKNDFTEGSDILIEISVKLNDHCNSLVLNQSNNIIVKTCDQSTPTISDKHLLASNIETVILKRSLDNSNRFPSSS